MLLLSALLMPCTPFRIGPTRIERELAELEQAAEQAGLDGVRLPFELDLVRRCFSISSRPARSTGDMFSINRSIAFVQRRSGSNQS